MERGKHYVYKCYVDGELRYIGMGKGGRYKHCASGVSSCSELNRDFHAGKEIKVEFEKKGLSESAAAELEASLIEENMPRLYNKVVKRNQVSRPGVKSSTVVRVLYSSWSTGDERNKYHDYLLGLGVDPDSDGYIDMVSNLTQNGLAFYVVELPTKTKMLVIDKLDDIQCEKWMNAMFPHLAHPEGLYGARTGLHMELGWL